jgi:hypothetical protein
MRCLAASTTRSVPRRSGCSPSARSNSAWTASITAGCMRKTTMPAVVLLVSSASRPKSRSRVMMTRASASAAARMALCLAIRDAPAHLAACSGRFLATREFRRIGNTHAHVLNGKFGVKALDNLLEGHALLDELEHAIHRNTGPANTSLTEVYSRVDDDAVEHDGSVGPLSVGAKRWEITSCANGSSKSWQTCDHRCRRSSVRRNSSVHLLTC